MELNTAALVGFRTRWETMLNQAYNLTETLIDKVAVKVDSGRVAQVTHRWLRGIPGMREFLDTRTINNVDSDGVTVKNKKWEDTISIPREDLERDQYKLYDPLVSRFGQVAKLHRDILGFELLSDMLTDTSIKAYDGIAFYGNHNGNRASNSAFNNKADGALNETNLSAGIVALRKRRDTQGNVLAAVRKKPLLIIPPDLEFTVQKLANSSFIVSTQPGTGASSSTSQASMAENTLKGSFDYEVAPYLKTGTEWHLTLQDPIMKPLIWQIEEEIQFDSWEKFLFQWTMNDKFVLGARALYNVAPGLPEFAYGSTGVS